MGEVSNRVNRSMSMAVDKVLNAQNAVASCISGMGVMSGSGWCLNSATVTPICSSHLQEFCFDVTTANCQRKSAPKKPFIFPKKPRFRGLIWLAGGGRAAIFSVSEGREFVIGR